MCDDIRKGFANLYDCNTMVSMLSVDQHSQKNKRSFLPFVNVVEMKLTGKVPFMWHVWDYLTIVSKRILSVF